MSQLRVFLLSKRGRRVLSVGGLIFLGISLVLLILSARRLHSSHHAEYHMLHPEVHSALDSALTSFQRSNFRLGVADLSREKVTPDILNMAIANANSAVEYSNSALWQVSEASYCWNCNSPPCCFEASGSTGPGRIWSAPPRVGNLFPSDLTSSVQTVKIALAHSLQPVLYGITSRLGQVARSIQSNLHDDETFYQAKRLVTNIQRFSENLNQITEIRSERHEMDLAVLTLQNALSHLY
jgi:hypothetical protein